MLYSLLRIMLFLSLFILFLFFIKKIKITNKKALIIFSLVICIVLCTISFLLPFENRFIKFKSPQDVFYYTSCGEILDTVYGDNSCMIYYSKGKNTYSYQFIEKTKNSYNILSHSQIKRVSKKLDSNTTFEIYNIKGTSDYYFLGIVDPKEQNIGVFDENNIRINTDVKRVENSSFIYFFLNGYAEDYYLLVKGNKIYL